VTSTLAQARQNLRGREDIYVIAGATAVFAWSIGPLMTRAMSVSLPALIFWRMLVAIPLMTGIAYATGGGLDKAILKRAALPSIFFATSMIVGFGAVRETSIANATVITTIQPVIVMFIAPKLFGERLHGRQIGLSVITFIGVLMVILAAADTSGATLYGDILALMNTLLWTTYFLMSKRHRNDNVHSWSFLAAVFLWSSLISIPWALWTADDIGGMKPIDWVWVMGMSLLPGVVGHGLMTWASKSLDVSLASLLGLMSPVIASVGAWLVYDQALGATQLIGGVLVLGSLALIVRLNRATARAETAELLSPPPDPLVS
jgi:drug/metabolite transporter (DMT)-like permease